MTILRSHRGAAYLLFCLWLSSVSLCGGEEGQCSSDSATGQCSAAGSESSASSSCCSAHATGTAARVPFWQRIAPGPNEVPVKYLLDMAKFPADDFSWVGAFCDGEVAGCTDKLDFPGPQAESQIGYWKVRKLVSEMPSKEWSGEWWRGNELGTLLNNPYYYYEADAQKRPKLSPMSIALGISPKQHAVVRPIFERSFGLHEGNWEVTTAYIEKTADQLIASVRKRGVLTHNDLKVWFHKVANKMAFDREVSDEYSQKFIDLQGKFLPSQIVSQAYPGFLYGIDPMKLDLEGTRAGIREFVAEYKSLLQQHHGDLLKGQDCWPSVSCEEQAAYAMYDAFVSAGGVSVPGTIYQALAVVFSTHETNPAGKPLRYSPEQAGQLIWEAIRIFPPVVVFPYWSPRPTCAGMTAEQTAALNGPDGTTVPCPLGKPSRFAGFPKVNQYQGGRRFMPNVAIAQRDPKIWGNDTLTFKLRPLELYEEYSLGFAETAEDAGVAGGRMNRSCPGRRLALYMGEAFLRRFAPDDWTVNPDVPIKIKTGGPYIKEEFTMFTKAHVHACKKACGCPADSSQDDSACQECVRKDCYTA